MFKVLQHLITSFFIFPLLAIAAEPVPLSETSYKADLGVLIMQINWGRQWKCGAFENAQLQALSFTKLSASAEQAVSLEFETPSRLLVENKFLPYAWVVEPGEYFLSGFDVKVARSVRNVAHIQGNKDNLFKEGKPIGGSFTVKPGEIVYIGHFGLDCGAEPFLWRYYLADRQEFESYIKGFREKFPFVKNIPVQYRLFSSEVFGHPFSLSNPTVK